MFFNRLMVALAVLQPAAPGQEGFVPVTPGTATEQLPAAPLVVAAYAIIWIVVMVYLWTIWRRLTKVETDMRALEQRRASTPGSR